MYSFQCIEEQSWSSRVPTCRTSQEWRPFPCKTYASQSIGQLKMICIEDLRYPSKFFQIASKEPGSLQSSLAQDSKYLCLSPSAQDNPDYTICSKRKKASRTCWISVRYLAVLSDILGSLVLTRLEIRFASSRCSLRVWPCVSRCSTTTSNSPTIALPPLVYASPWSLSAASVAAEGRFQSLVSAVQTGHGSARDGIWASSGGANVTAFLTMVLNCTIGGIPYRRSCKSHHRQHFLRALLSVWKNILIPNLQA